MVYLWLNVEATPSWHISCFYSHWWRMFTCPIHHALPFFLYLFLECLQPHFPQRPSRIKYCNHIRSLVRVNYRLVLNDFLSFLFSMAQLNAFTLINEDTYCNNTNKELKRGWLAGWLCKHREACLRGWVLGPWQQDKEAGRVMTYRHVLDMFPLRFSVSMHARTLACSHILPHANRCNVVRVVHYIHLYTGSILVYLFWWHKIKCFG